VFSSAIFGELWMHFSFQLSFLSLLLLKIWLLVFDFNFGWWVLFYVVLVLFCLLVSPYGKAVDLVAWLKLASCTAHELYTSFYCTNFWFWLLSFTCLLQL